MPKETLLMISNYLPATRWNKNIWHYMAERLSSSGWEIITTSSKENQFLRLLDMLRTVWKERNNFRLAQIDVFSGKAFIYAEACTMLLNRLNKPIILTLHGGKLPEFSEQYPKRLATVLQSAEVVVTPSPFIQSALASFRADIRLIPNPIDLSSAIFRVRKTPNTKLIWVRAFHRIYNPSQAAKVVKLLTADFPNIELMMLGPDKGDGSLTRMMATARDSGVENKIKVIGGVAHTEIPTWLNKADIFINTSNYDTAPRSVLEAMANGLCVVSTNVGGVPDILKDGESGLIVAPDNPQAMANAIYRILSEPGLAERLSTHARQRAEQFDWSIILPQWEKIFSEEIKVHDE